VQRIGHRSKACTQQRIAEFLVVSSVFGLQTIDIRFGFDCANSARVPPQVLPNPYEMFINTQQ
jgi:hypothetical protein